MLVSIIERLYHKALGRETKYQHSYPKENVKTTKLQDFLDTTNGDLRKYI